MSPGNRSSGTARRNPQPTEPEKGGNDPRSNDPDSGDRALDREREMGAVDTVHDAGRQPGAHGKQSPHRNVKPGTRRSIEEADPQQGQSDS
ncbi:MAG TPA: hypothetical protein VHG09_15235 [Longimicrobiales bacterium]|nr:hypothetical protein [Longimicrobiales bacterium]